MDKGAKKKMPKPAKVLIVVIASIVIALFLIIAIVNIVVHTMYSQYYADSTREFRIPGNDSGFVVQDIDYVDSADAWMFSGYMNDSSASPVYIMGNGDEEDPKRITVNEPDGTLYTGHGGGITSNDYYAFLTCEEGYLIFRLSDVLNAGNGSNVQAIDRVELDFAPAFLNMQDGVLYTGNFYSAGDYETPDEHHVTTPAGEFNQAVMYAYPADTAWTYGVSRQASVVYSIPDHVQGICILPNGDFVFSTSYGLSTSELLVFSEPEISTGSTFTVDGRDVPLMFFDSDNLIDTVEAPPMSEGIVFYDGKVYVSNEASSDKYIFGKLYDDGFVRALEL